ncbi:MAG TPA: sulfur carrier protein ThiS [Chthoniobacterales bacterium]|jgi:sulfur carrier protein|nr:sulfur carrier protein ThiS [Chthoniobacterales bacterium]
MKLTLNGQARDLATGVTLSELLASLELADKMVLVERNGDAVPRADFPIITLGDGDTIEIVRMVGGG